MFPYVNTDKLILEGNNKRIVKLHTQSVLRKTRKSFKLLKQNHNLN